MMYGSIRIPVGHNFVNCNTMLIELLDTNELKVISSAFLGNIKHQHHKDKAKGLSSMHVWGTHVNVCMDNVIWKDRLVRYEVLAAWPA